MHSRLFFSKKTAVHCVVNAICTAVFFSTKTAVRCVLECYMHGSLFSLKILPRVILCNAICTEVCFFFWKYCRVLYFGMLYARQFNSICSFETTKLLLRRNNRIWQIGLVCKASSVTPHQTRWYNKIISIKDYSIPLGFLWIENCKLNFPRKYCHALNLEY